MSIELHEQVTKYYSSNLYSKRILCHFCKRRANNGNGYKDKSVANGRKPSLWINGKYKIDGTVNVERGKHREMLRLFIVLASSNPCNVFLVHLVLLCVGHVSCCALFFLSSFIRRFGCVFCFCFSSFPAFS